MKSLLIFDYKSFKQIPIKYFDLIIFRIVSLLKKKRYDFDFIYDLKDIQKININSYDFILSCLYLAKYFKNKKNVNFINNIYFNEKYKIKDFLNNPYFLDENIFSFNYDETFFNTYQLNPLILYSFNCDYNCSFCVFKKYNFFRNIEDLLNELFYIEFKYKNLFIELLSLDILYNYKKTILFLKEKIENKINLPLTSNLVLSKKLSLETIEIFKDANLKNLKIGIESLSEKTRKKMNKNIIQIEELYEIINLFDNAFKINFNFMVGFEKNKNEIEKNLKNFEKFLQYFKFLISKISFYVYNKQNNFFIKELYDLIQICKKNKVKYECHF